MTFVDFIQKWNIKDWNNPLSFYDYKAAHKAGATRDQFGHFPSKFKDDLHPNRFIMYEGGWYDTKYERDAKPEEKIIYDMQRKEFEEFNMEMMNNAQ